MPRSARASAANLCYHVLNRGNARDPVFHDDGGSEAFVALLGDACQRLPMRIVGFCLMPNHFHLVLWPHGDGDLSRWMQWLLTAHVRRYHRHYHGSGHVWQGRFKAFPIQEDEHLRVVLRDVERKPLRAGLVARAEDWRWSSLRGQPDPRPLPFLVPGPAPRGTGWVEAVNATMSEPELARVRHSIRRGTPFGSGPWSRQTADRLDLNASLNPADGREKSRKSRMSRIPSAGMGLGLVEG